MRWSACCLLLSGCVNGVNQVAGTGAIYHTRCSSDMLPIDGQYRAQCEPEPCLSSYVTGPVSHVVVALDPGRKIVGYAERVCIQDLARSSGLFNPVMVEQAADQQAAQQPVADPEAAEP